MDRKERINELKEESHKLLLQRDKVHDELSKLERDLSFENHPCTCVKLNRDIEIYNMGEQERRKRRGIGFGLVAETLSALMFCPECEGTGIPKTCQVTVRH